MDLEVSYDFENEEQVWNGGFFKAEQCQGPARG
jgi:hypothetical protein